MENITNLIRDITIRHTATFVIFIIGDNHSVLYIAAEKL